MGMGALFGSNERMDRLFEVVRSVLGPQEVEPFNVGGSAHYRLQGWYRGRLVRVTVRSSKGLLRAIELAFSLENRPITLLLNHRRNTTIYAVPEVRTSDPRFDEIFLVNGFPSEVLQKALDPSVRQWLLDRYGKIEPPLATEGGFLQLHVMLCVSEGAWHSTRERDMEAVELVYWLDHLLSIREGLCAAFDEKCSAIAQQYGPAAVTQWVGQQTNEMDARAKRRLTIRWIVFGVFVGLPILLAVSVLAVVLVGMLLAR